MNKSTDDAGQVRHGVVALKVFEELQDRQDSRLAASEGQVGDDVASEGDDRHAVEVRQCDVRQRGRELAGEVELGRLAEVHAPRSVEQEINVEVLFLLEPFEQQLVVAGVDIPVEVSEVVSRRIFAVVGEFDAAAKLHR